MKIAVIGAGFSGCSIALKLSKYHEVTLYEKEKSILSGASAYNQMRFHQGYHYPRSQKTINEIKKSKGSFLKFFGSNIFGKTKNYYAIAKKNTKTDPKKYELFLKKNRLYFKILKKSKLFSKNISHSYLVKEEILNYFKFKKKIQKMIKLSNIKLRLNDSLNKKNLQKFDKIIVSCYSENNDVLRKLGVKNNNKFRYELIEKIIIELPKKYINKSFVVIDGKFVCCDPYVGTKFHLLSDVVNSKIEVVQGKYPKFKSKKKKFVNVQPKRHNRISLFRSFVDKSSMYLPFLKEAKYVKSMYTVRTIKIRKEKTDERTNFIRKLNNKIYVVLTGKWNTSVKVADKFNDILK